MTKKFDKIKSDRIFLKPKIKKAKCVGCGTEFEIKPNARFTRKYCSECSKKNKDYYESLDSITVDDCED